MKTALVTGGARRIGAQICRTLHQYNYNIIIHYKHSSQNAQNLADSLNLIRKKSATTLQTDLSNNKGIDYLLNTVKSIDLLVNNASVFYPTIINGLKHNDYQSIMNTNLMAPLFLSTGFSKKLIKNKGCIINIIDIHSERPLKDYVIYNISKAAIAMATKTLAKELAPNVRVCGISPGSILWPANNASPNQSQKNTILKKIALKKQGCVNDIANTVLFLANSDYITGQIINVDGGRTLNQ